MSFAAKVLNFMFNKFDTKRDAGLTSPEDVVRHNDIQYGEDPKWNALDVYYPKGTEKPLPTIVRIHGGGYVYGTKEVYQYYGMNLAQRGFTFVNFNYHLAPARKFPTQLGEINQVLEWMCANAAEYCIDTNNICIVGDSAGAQLGSQYSLMWADPEYAALFDIKVPDFRLAAIALNCGMYEPQDGVPAKGMMKMMKSLLKDYYDGNPAQWADVMNVTGRIRDNYPPSYVMSAAHDFLKDNCQPMAELLESRGVPVEWKIYGTEEDKMAQHIFHCNIRYDLATVCNDAEAAFFRKYIR